MKKSYVLSDKDFKDTVLLNARLVEIPTVSPEGENYEDFVALLEGELEQRYPGVKMERVIVPPEVYEDIPEFRAQFVGERINLVGLIKAEGKPKAHLNCHYDVVAPGDLDKWTVTLPFTPRLVEDRQYGRGACDMKGSIASLLKALEIIHREQRELKYDISLSFTPDEEPTQYSGLKYLVDETLRGRPYIEADFFYSLDATQNEISIGKAGTIDFEIKIRGKATHIARSYTGINAIQQANFFLNALFDLKLEVESFSSKYPANPDLSIGFVHPNLNVNVIHGGSNNSSVADSCVILGNRTVLPDESENPVVFAQNQLVTTILKIKQKYQIDCDFRVIPGLPPFISSLDDPYLQALRIASSRREGKLFPVACSMGPNDIAWVKELLGIPTFSRGVQREGCNVHSFDENVPIENLKIAVEDLVDFLSTDIKE